MYLVKQKNAVEREKKKITRSPIKKREGNLLVISILYQPFVVEVYLLLEIYHIHIHIPHLLGTVG